MLTFDATEQINEVSRTTRTTTTTQVITRYFGRWPQTKTKKMYLRRNTNGWKERQRCEETDEERHI